MQHAGGKMSIMFAPFYPYLFNMMRHTVTTTLTIDVAENCIEIVIGKLNSG